MTEPQYAHTQFIADIMLGLLDLMEQAPKGSKVIFGGACIEGFSELTPEKKEEMRAHWRAISEAPTIPGVFRDRIIQQVGKAIVESGRDRGGARRPHA